VVAAILMVQKARVTAGTLLRLFSTSLFMSFSPKALRQCAVSEQRLHQMRVVANLIAASALSPSAGFAK
jgi:hypothetical protein